MLFVTQRSGRHHVDRKRRSDSIVTSLLLSLSVSLRLQDSSLWIPFTPPLFLLSFNFFLLPPAAPLSPPSSPVRRMRASSAPASDPPRFLSRGRGLEVALQFAHGRLVQREQVEVERGVGDVEVARFLDQVHDLL